MKTKIPSTDRQSQRRNVRVEFHDDAAQAVFIAGSFNEWNPTATPLIALGDGKWAKELSLPPGRYEYRLVVYGQWTCDPAAPEQISNGYGSSNSVLVVRPKPGAKKL